MKIFVTLINFYFMKRLLPLNLLILKNSFKSSAQDYQLFISNRFYIFEYHVFVCWFMWYSSDVLMLFYTIVYLYTSVHLWCKVVEFLLKTWRPVRSQASFFFRWDSICLPRFSLCEFDNLPSESERWEKKADYKL